jgi:hypothetical protein
VIAGEAVAVPDNAERRLEDDADGHSGRRREDGSHSRGHSRSRSADAGGGQAEPARPVHERLGRAARGSGDTPRGGLLGSLRPLDAVPEEPTDRALGSSASLPMPPMAFELQTEAPTVVPGCHDDPCLEAQASPTAV